MAARVGDMAVCTTGNSWGSRGRGGVKGGRSEVEGRGERGGGGGRRERR